MTSTVISPFHGLPLQEVVPDAMEVKGVSKSSLLTGRRRIRFQPQSGTTANPGSIVQFVLADSSCLLDVNSMVISYNAVTAGTSGTASLVTLDDGPAWCRRVQVSINGQLLDDTDNAHRNANAQVLMNADRSWYSGPGSFAGYWNQNSDLANTYQWPDASGAVATAPKRFGDVVAGGTNAAYRTGGYNGGNTSQVTTVRMSQAIPMGLLSSSLRCKQYWPLSQMGELVIQLTLAQNAEAIVNYGSADTGAAYQLQDIFIECDLISPHYMYQELLNKVTQMEGEHGLVIPVDTTIVAQGQSIPGGAAESSIVVSRATNNLRKVFVTNTPTAALSSATYPSVSCFPSAGFQQVQFRIGSLYFPSQPANSLARAFWMTQAAFGSPTNDRGGVANIYTYGNNTASSGTITGGAVTNATTLPYASPLGLRFSDSFVLGYSFDNYKGGEALDADGVSVLGQAGSQLVCVVRNAPAEAITPTISLIATKYIQLKDGALKILGV